MRKNLYFMTLFALVAVAAMTVFFNTTGTVSANGDVTVSRGRQATIEMLGRALDFRTGSDIAVFANKGISDNGSSRITGNVAALEAANVKGLNRGNIQGNMLRREDGFDVNQAQMDLASSFSILRNLPATVVADSNLSGKTFKAGVYSLASARLEGDMTLDANNDPNSIFVFKVSSALSTGRGSRVVLANGAYAANVFFVVEDTATVAEGTDFNGSIFAGNNVTVNSAKVTGRAVSVNGTVSLNAAEIVQQMGFLEICKAVDPATDPRAQATTTSPTGTTALIGRVFSFTAGGQTFQVVAGALGGPLQCSTPRLVPSGPITVTELGTTTNTAGGVTRTGGFIITDVSGGTQSPNVVVSTNFPASTAVVNVGAAATIAGETQITVINRAAITGIIEICKVAAAGDTDANSTGPGGAQGTLFSFIIDGVLDANGDNVVFQAPLGTVARPGCTGPLTITLPANTVGGTVTTLTIAELPQPGFIFVTATAAGNGGAIVGTPQVITTGAFAGGGIFQVNINNLATTANQTLVTVTNRTVPGQIKICKVAGPGVTQGDVFNFLVTGTPVNPLTGAAITVRGGAVGVDVGGGLVTELVQVQAGPVGNPFCTFSQNRFASGSSVNINEVLTAAQLLAGIRLGRVDVSAAFGSPATTTFATNGINGGTGGNLTLTQINAIAAAFGGTTGFGTAAQIAATLGSNLTNAQVTAIGVALVGNAAFTGLTAAQISALVNTGNLTNAQITAIGVALVGNAAFTGLTAVQISALITTTTAQGVNVVGAATGVTVTARTEVVVVTFTNFVFTPAALKICKVAGAGVAVGTPFTFTVTGDTQGGVLAPFSTTVTVQAGPASQGGFCTQVNGPFAGTVAGGFGSFDIGSNITITETGVTGFTTTSITSTTGVSTGTTVNLVTGSITTPIFTAGTAAANLGNIVEVTFVNTATPAAIVASTRFDFDGDMKADVSVFRPSNGAWYLQNSSTGFRGVQFGQAGDKLVAADYDGDGKSDIAVYRPSTSTWYLNRSTAGFAAVQFGAAGDIATPADFDRDGKAELAVYRPSSGMWITLSLATNKVNFVPFGAGNDIPVAADYDGDGQADYAVYRPSNGVWYMLQSTKGFGAIQFGNATDRPVVADYDGDGRADQAVYRTGAGLATWYVMGSKVGLLVNQFGLDTDSPVPADYDGDGKTDFGVYRASTGTWYATRSAVSPGNSSGSALMIIQFGNATDTPVPMP
jgi:hypothetical protein